MDYHQSTPRDDGADDVLDDDGVLDVDDKMRVVREVRFERASRRLKRANERTRAMRAFDRVPNDSFIVRSCATNGRTNGRTNATVSFESRRW